MITGHRILLGAAVLATAAGLEWTAAAADDLSSSCFDKAMTQLEITACAERDARAADGRLNAAYKDLLRYLDPSQTRRLQAAQRAWLAYRDADCGFWGEGDFSLALTNRSNCIADLSNRRAEELEGWPPNAPRSAVQPYRPGS